MFSDVGQARTNAAMLLLMIATTSSRTCTKPIVVCLCIYHAIYFSIIFKFNKFILFRKRQDAMSFKKLSSRKMYLH